MISSKYSLLISFVYFTLNLYLMKYKCKICKFIHEHVVPSYFLFTYGFMVQFLDME